jgi:hypothetical protein
MNSVNSKLQHHVRHLAQVAGPPVEEEEDEYPVLPTEKADLDKLYERIYAPM